MTDTMPSTDWKGMLITSLKRNFRLGVVTARYECEMEGPPHTPTFHVNLTLKHQGYRSPAIFDGEQSKSKKDAEQSAAEKAVRALEATDDLTALFGSPLEGGELAEVAAVETEADTPKNFKGKLQEKLVELKNTARGCLVNASYATQKTGPEHAPIFQTSVTLVKAEFATDCHELRLMKEGVAPRFEGERMDSKKASEHSAAKSALQALAKMDEDLNELFTTNSPPAAA